MRARAVIATALLSAGLMAAPAEAANHAVDIEDFDFAPAELTVDRGDSVTWTNRDGVTHTVTSSNGLWNSGGIAPGATFTRTFTDAGSFAYFCAPHPSMTGRVDVRGEGTVPQPPDNVTARPGSSVGAVSVTWTPTVITGGSPVLSYRVCRTGPGATACTSVSGTSFTDTNRPVLQTQTYVVSAVNSFGEGPPSGEVCSKPFPWHAQLGC